MPRLNFGSSFDIQEGWINLDKDDHGQDVIADVLEGLPFEDDCFECIVANHSIQMIRFDDLPRALAELRRVLKPGGTLRILVPDYDWAVEQYEDHQSGTLPIGDQLEPTASGKLLRYLFWHGDARSAFTGHSLAETLRRAKFVGADVCAFGKTWSQIPEVTSLDSREDESLIVEGIK